MRPERQIEAAVRAALSEIAPDADLDGLDPEGTFHEQLEIDSVDFLRLITALEAELEIQVPHADYARLASLAGCVRYLSNRLPDH